MTISPSVGNIDSISCQHMLLADYGTHFYSPLPNMSKHCATTIEMMIIVKIQSKCKNINRWIKTHLNRLIQTDMADKNIHVHTWTHAHSNTYIKRTNTQIHRYTQCHLQCVHFVWHLFTVDLTLHCLYSFHSVRFHVLVLFKTNVGMFIVFFSVCSLFTHLTVDIFATVFPFSSVSHRSNTKI